jgi:tetratricopeptide (TPR) repeat protein/DNA-binding CsgD family transcriptional regulator
MIVYKSLLVLGIALVFNSVALTQNVTLKDDFFNWVDANSETKAPVIIDSLLYYENVLSKQKDYFLQARVLDKLAWIYFFELASFDRSMETVEKIRKLHEVSGDSRILIMYYENMGMLYYESNTDKEKALDFFVKAYDLAIEDKSHYQLESILNNYGVALMNQQRFDESKKQLFEAVRYAKTNNDLIQESVAWSNLGICYLYIGDMDSVEIAMLRAYNLALKTPMKDDDGLRAAFLGRFYKDQGEYTKALTYLRKAEELIVHMKTFGNKAFTYKTLSDTYAEMGDYQSALNSLNTFTIYKDSLDFTALTKQLWNAENEMKLKELDAQRKYETAEKENAQYTEKLWYLIIILFLSIAATIVFLINIRLRAKSRLVLLSQQKNELEREKLALEVEGNEREVAAKSLFLLEKDNLISKVIKHLKELSAELKPNERGAIQLVISDLKSSLNTKSWDEFELRFSKVHPNFYRNIEAEFSALTLNEKKLCAFLVMNLTTKEISSITGQTTHSINVARTRLRKKLGIVNSNVTFYDFLVNYV